MKMKIKVKSIINNFDIVTITMTMSFDVTDVWQCDHDVTLTLTLDLNNKK